MRHLSESGVQNELMFVPGLDFRKNRADHAENERLKNAQPALHLDLVAYVQCTAAETT